MTIMPTLGRDLRVIGELQTLVGEINEANGWHMPGSQVAIRMAADIALIQSEASEALEWIRKHGGKEDPNGLQIDVDGKVVGLPSELADVVIRVMDFCDKYDVDLAAAIDAKLANNKTRGYRHGGKVL